MITKGKTDSKFSRISFNLVKFGKNLAVWYNVANSLLKLGNTNLQNLKKLPAQAKKFVPHQVWCCVKNLKEFTKGNSRKSQTRPYEL